MTQESKKFKDFKAYFIIPEEPNSVYLALTTESTAILWTGGNAQIDPKVDGSFSLWDGAIVGKFLELDPENYTIVQEWYFGEQEEKSIVSIKLHEHKKGTSMEVRQSNIPLEDFDNITSGWTEEYAGGLIDFYS